MLAKPNMNGVAKRCNRMLEDMVRSIINYSSLPKSLWEKTLKTGCLVELRPYTQNEMNLDLKTVSYYIVGYHK